MTAAAKAFCAVVLVAAGASGVALMLFPGSTGDYFSWRLQPPGAASLIGGFYLASAMAFGAALRLPWRQVRPLLVSVLFLAVPTLVLTLVHDEVFDFGRWQALAWVGLFVVAPLSAAGILAAAPRDRAGGPRLPPWSRVALGGLALGLAVVGILVWFEPTRGDVRRFSPVDLVRLTGAYLGAWCSFLAALTGWVAWRATWDDARLPLITLAAAAAGAAVGLLRSAEDVRHLGVALAVSAGIGALAVALYRQSAPNGSSRRPRDH